MSAELAANPPLDARASRWLSLRFILLIVGLLILNALIADGLLLLRPPAGQDRLWLVFFAVGCSSFWPVLMALWLAWGGGNLIARLLVALCLAAAKLACTLALVHLSMKHSLSAIVQPFTGDYLRECAMIFSMQLIHLPLRGWLGWELGFSRLPELAKPRRGVRWSLFDVVGYTAFAAFALALVRLFDLWIVSGGASERQRWIAQLSLLKSDVLAIGMSAAAFAILLDGISWRWRLAAIALAIALCFAGELGYFAILRPARLSPLPVAAGSVGTVLAALVNFAILRFAGMQLWRQRSALTVQSNSVSL